MPELPEVETIVRGLRKLVTGYTIEDVVIRKEKLVARPTVEGFKEGLKGRIIQEIERRGKYILIKVAADKTLQDKSPAGEILEPGEGPEAEQILETEMTLVVHLRMTGRLLVLPREADYDKHTHIILQLERGLDLRFHDIRKFGRMYLVDRDDYRPVGGLLRLGPEPLSPAFTLEVFAKGLKGRKANIKALQIGRAHV